MDAGPDEFANICRERVPEEAPAERLFAAVRCTASRWSGIRDDAIAKLQTGRRRRDPNGMEVFAT